MFLNYFFSSKEYWPQILILLRTSLYVKFLFIGCDLWLEIIPKKPIQIFVLNIKVFVFLDNSGQFMKEHLKCGNSKLDYSSKTGLFIGADFWVNQLTFVKDKNG